MLMKTFFRQSTLLLIGFVSVSTVVGFLVAYNLVAAVEVIVLSTTTSFFGSLSMSLLLERTYVAKTVGGGNKSLRLVGPGSPLSPTNDFSSVLRRNSSTTSGMSNAFSETEMSSFVTHEVRTALSGIVGVVPMLRDTHLTPDQSNLIDLIEISGNHLMSFVNIVLDHGKMRAGRLQLERVRMDIGRELETAVMVCAPSARAKGIDLNLYYPCDMPHIMSDPCRFRQVIINLIHNAIKFTPSGFIAVRCEHDETTLTFKVMDSGLGMSREAAESLFSNEATSMYTTSETQRQYGGTGLGMYLVKGMVRLLGGTIRVSSEKNVGSTFEVILPIPRESYVERSNPTSPTTTKKMNPLSVPDIHMESSVMMKTVLVLMRIPPSGGQTPSTGSSAFSAASQLHEYTTEWVVQAYLKDFDASVIVPESMEELDTVTAPPILVLSTPQVLDDPGCRAILDRWKIVKICVCLTPGYKHPDILLCPILQDTLSSCLQLAEEYAVLSARRSTVSSVTTPLTPVTPTRLSTSGSILTGIRALVAEDNYVARRVLMGLLTTLRVQCIGVDNGQAALDTFKSHTQKGETFDIIFLDSEMPVLSGPEVAVAMREFEEQLSLDAVPIIALSGHDTDTLIATFPSANGHITKPASREMLISVLETFTNFVDRSYSVSSSLKSFYRNNSTDGSASSGAIEKLSVGFEIGRFPEVLETPGVAN